jgi:hypothetical protein
VLEDDWVTVEGLIAASGEVMGASKPLPQGCSVPAATVAELGLYRSEANNRRAIAALTRAILSGAPDGEVGRLSLSSVDVRPVSGVVLWRSHAPFSCSIPAPPPSCVCSLRML